MASQQNAQETEVTTKFRKVDERVPANDSSPLKGEALKDWDHHTKHQLRYVRD